MVRRLSCCVLCMLPVFQLLAQSCTTPADSLTDSSCDFWRQQLCFPRVRAAQATTGVIVASRLHPLGLTPQQLEIFLRLIKTNRELEVWGCTLGAGPFALLHAYPLAATSGQLDPKRHTGDYQVPEGFYEIYRFNPQSNFHLSLGLNYPNTADRALGEPAPGSGIFIHGGAVTMGYLPIIDAGIEEVYLLTVMVRAASYPGS